MKSGWVSHSGERQAIVSAARKSSRSINVGRPIGNRTADDSDPRENYKAGSTARKAKSTARKAKSAARRAKSITRILAWRTRKLARKPRKLERWKRRICSDHVDIPDSKGELDMVINKAACVLSKKQTKHLG